MTGLRFAFLPLGAALFVASSLSLARAAQDVELLRATPAMASDGSVRVALDFNGPAPDARVFRSNGNLVHVVFVGATFRKRPELADMHLGELSRGRFTTFAGIGMRLDLSVRDYVRVRTEIVGKTAIVHIPA